jgi:hypothetical protein
MSRTTSKIKYLEATTSGLQRLKGVVSSLPANAFVAVLENGWTVSATLAHLAFWDRWVEARWDHFSRAGSFHDLPDDITALVNQSAQALWLALPAEESLRLCLDAAASVTLRITQLARNEIEAALKTNRVYAIFGARHFALSKCAVLEQ